MAVCKNEEFLKEAWDDYIKNGFTFVDPAYASSFLDLINRRTGEIPQQVSISDFMQYKTGCEDGRKIFGTGEQKAPITTYQRGRILDLKRVVHLSEGRKD